MDDLQNINQKSDFETNKDNTWLEKKFNLFISAQEECFRIYSEIKLS